MNEFVEQHIISQESVKEYDRPVIGFITKYRANKWRYKYIKSDDCHNYPIYPIDDENHDKNNCLSCTMIELKGRTLGDDGLIDFFRYVNTWNPNAKFKEMSDHYKQYVKDGEPEYIIVDTSVDDLYIVLN